MSQHRWLLALCCLLFSAPSLATDASLRIVATTTQAADLAQRLSAGVDGLHITPLMGAGVDPHLYQPTESDIAAMNQAQMVIYSGLHLEGQFDTVFAALAEQGVAVYALSAPVKAAGFIIGGYELSEELTNVDDPHFWFDPRNWQLTAQGLAERLALLDPANAATYTANAAAYSEQLQWLFDWAEAGLTSIAAGQRYLVSSHDAFQYFGAAFGWQLQAIQGISTEDEAGVGDIQQTVDFVIANDIPVLFVESSVPPDTIEAVLAALSAQGQATRIGVRELYGDAMEAPGSFGGTYIGMLAQNVLTIMQSYQCMDAPVEIPAWPPDLLPAPPQELWDADCHA
ncbi:MAG: zinc ABC transporter substrate-binding protein [Chloroflexi bacterium]|nr:zinc ABC transporter substrate-binding protein [Chloroflexota bacterium]MCY3582986.1 zinc ABC transporter substrate-binding protein [Chloroflexota bacterium]MCY3716890.1 zinc ABC transporter substrate-binding protein [Chloroflexota bacterium]MDE2650104.1 zinc ABC transporter substrate-binding protein [Chloroflexota bacterium]MXV93076.1 manganese transporter [Chloroflexota bacterium]